MQNRKTLNEIIKIIDAAETDLDLSNQDLVNIILHYTAPVSDPTVPL